MVLESTQFAQAVRTPSGRRHTQQCVTVLAVVHRIHSTALFVCYTTSVLKHANVRPDIATPMTSVLREGKMAAPGAIGDDNQRAYGEGVIHSHRPDTRLVFLL